MCFGNFVFFLLFNCLFLSFAHFPVGEFFFFFSDWFGKNSSCIKTMRFFLATSIFQVRYLPFNFCIFNAQVCLCFCVIKYTYAFPNVLFLTFMFRKAAPTLIPDKYFLIFFCNSCWFVYNKCNSFWHMVWGRSLLFSKY